MKNIFFKKWYLYGFLSVIILLVIAEIIVQGKSDEAITDTQMWVDHTYDVLHQANTVQALCKDLQSNDRAYVITTSPSVSAIIDLDAKAVMIHIDSLAKLTRDNPLQQKRIDSLYAVVDDRIVFSKLYVSVRDSQGFAAAAGLMSQGKGIAISDKISGLLDRIQSEERSLLAIRKAASARSIQRVKNYYFIPFLCLTALIISFIIFLLVKSNTDLQKVVLEKSEEIEKRAKKFEVLLQNSFEGIVMMDKDFNYLYKGTSVEKITGHPPEDQSGAERIEQVHPEDKLQFDAIMQKVLLNPGQSFEIVYRGQHKKGHYIWLEGVITNRLDDKNVKAIVFNIRDVSLRVEMAQQKDEFLTMVSHELRTPVTSLKVLGHILHDKFFAKKEDENLTLVTRLNEQTNKLMRLITDLIEINKLNFNQMQYTHALFSLDGAVDEVIKDLNRISLTHTIIKNRFEPIEIDGDKERMIQVVTNLILNAIKYSPLAKEVVVTLYKENNEAFFSIKDEGIGVDITESEKIFQRYYRSKKDYANTYPGFGMGLYVSMEIIKAHGGKVWVESGPGKGSEFYFSLPLPTKERMATVLN